MLAVVECSWDENKRLSNIKKHGIDFIDAKEIWNAGIRLETIEERKGEARLVTIGEVQGHVILVAYTWRDDTRRIISARRASRKERKHYQDAVGRGVD